jgi:hypothetical protein
MLYKYIRTFGNLLHCIWPYSLSQRFSRYYAWFYTAWIAHNVRKIGLHTEVEPGLYLVNGKKYIEIGDYCLIGRNSHITAHEMPQYNTPVKISIGDGCMFGPDMHITAVNSIRIGKTSARGKACSFRTIRTEIPKIWRSGTSHRMPGLFIPKVRSSSETMCGSGRKPRFWPESRSARGPSSVRMRWLQKIFPRIRSRQGFRPEL